MIIIIVMSSYAPISPKIKLNGINKGLSNFVILNNERIIDG